VRIRRQTKKFFVSFEPFAQQLFESLFRSSFPVLVLILFRVFGGCSLFCVPWIAKFPPDTALQGCTVQNVISAQPAVPLGPVTARSAAVESAAADSAPASRAAAEPEG
jgi:hypothetical protein